MKELQQHHARQVMGIVASDRDRSIMAIAVQAVNIAFSSLVDREEKREALKILQQVQSSCHKTSAGFASHTDNISSTTSQWHLAADMLEYELLSEPKASFPVEQSWLRAGTVPNTILDNSVNQQHSTKLSTSNPLQSAYFGHAGQPYKTWYQPAGGSAFEGFDFEL